MKKGKKFFVVLLVILSVLSLVAFAAGCATEDDPGKDPGIVTPDDPTPDDPTPDDPVEPDTSEYSGDRVVYLTDDAESVSLNVKFYNNKVRELLINGEQLKTRVTYGEDALIYGQEFIQTLDFGANQISVTDNQNEKFSFIVFKAVTDEQIRYFDFDILSYHSTDSAATPTTIEENGIDGSSLRLTGAGTLFGFHPDGSFGFPQFSFVAGQEYVLSFDFKILDNTPQEWWSPLRFGDNGDVVYFKADGSVVEPESPLNPRVMTTSNDDGSYSVAVRFTVNADAAGKFLEFPSWGGNADILLDNICLSVANPATYKTGETNVYIEKDVNEVELGLYLPASGFKSIAVEGKDVSCEPILKVETTLFGKDFISELKNGANRVVITDMEDKAESFIIYKGYTQEEILFYDMEINPLEYSSWNLNPHEITEDGWLHICGPVEILAFSNFDTDGCPVYAWEPCKQYVLEFDFKLGSNVTANWWMPIRFDNSAGDIAYYTADRVFNQGALTTVLEVTDNEDGSKHFYAEFTTPEVEGLKLYFCGWSTDGQPQTGDIYFDNLLIMPKKMESESYAEANRIICVADSAESLTLNLTLADKQLQRLRVNGEDIEDGIVVNADAVVLNSGVLSKLKYGRNTVVITDKKDTNFTYYIFYGYNDGEAIYYDMSESSLSYEYWQLADHVTENGWLHITGAREALTFSNYVTGMPYFNFEANATYIMDFDFKIGEEVSDNWWAPMFLRGYNDNDEQISSKDIGYLNPSDAKGSATTPLGFGGSVVTTNADGSKHFHSVFTVSSEAKTTFWICGWGDSADLYLDNFSIVKATDAVYYDMETTDLIYSYWQLADHVTENGWLHITGAREALAFSNYVDGIPYFNFKAKTTYSLDFDFKVGENENSWWSPIRMNGYYYAEDGVTLVERILDLGYLNPSDNLGGLNIAAGTSGTITDNGDGTKHAHFEFTTSEDEKQTLWFCSWDRNAGGDVCTDLYLDNIMMVEVS